MATAYGQSTGFAIDPIEKKPLSHFLPATSILSFGTAGCNLGCRFCQNWHISKARLVEENSVAASPEQVVELAIRHGCPSLAMTYNDPTIFGEYVIDVSRIAKARGLRSILVTAGYITPEARQDVYAHIDAVNIDLKAFSETFYHKITFAHLEPVGTSNYAPYLFEAGQLIQVSRQDLSEHPLWKRCWESPVHQVRAHYCDANAPLPCFDDVTEVMLWQTLALASDKKVLLIASARDPYTFNGFHTWFTLAGVHLAGALNNAQLNSQLNEMVIRDGLMGIYNRRYLEQRLQEAFKVSERYQRPLSVLMVDIDHFKQVNDTYGHPVGDEVLKWVSRSIGQRLRTTDILGRYGGEEFLIILPETDLKGASKLAQSLVQRIEQLPVEQIVGGLHITISIGVCSYPQQATRAEDLVQIADQHLYQAKRQGRNQYTAGDNEPHDYLF